MKKIVLTLAIVCAASIAGFSQSAAPQLAVGTPAKHTEPVVGANKPKLKAYDKTPGTQSRQPADKPKPVLAATSTVEKPKE